MTTCDKSEAGFSLVEAIVATGLLAGALAALGQMFGIAVAATSSARTGTVAAVLAEQKMEQLRALPVPFTVGGPGLTPSPSNALATNVDGYVDYLDRFGRTIGGGSTVPAGAVYLRRWSIEPLQTNPNNTLILQVLVTTARTRRTTDGELDSTSRLRDEARLMTIKTRKSG